MGYCRGSEASVSSQWLGFFSTMTRMGCVSCGVEHSGDAKFCPQCGRKIEAEAEDDAGATMIDQRAPEPAEESSFDLKKFEAELLRPPRRDRWIAAAGVGLVGIAGVSLVLAAGDDARPPASLQGMGKQSEPNVQAAPARPAFEAWAAPPGPRQDVEALGYAFDELDHRDLGSLFDANLKPLYGAASLFEVHEPRRVRRDEMSHSFSRLTDTTQLDAGFRYFFAKLDKKWSVTREYRFYRAIQLAEVIHIDEQRPMRRPPDEAMFYLAEVHMGASYDVLIEGARGTMATSMGVVFAEASASLRDQTTREKYEVHQRGTGLRPKFGDAIFASTPEQVAQAYEVSAEPVPIQLVFRTIPGRTFKRKKLPVSKIVTNQTYELEEGASQTFKVTAGQYLVRIESQPKGVLLAWTKSANCTQVIGGSEQRNVEAECSVGRGNELQVTNWTQQYKGPKETVKVYLEKLPAPP